MPIKELPSAETLDSILEYDSESGDLRWKPRTPEMFDDSKQPQKKSCNTFNTRFAGRIAANADSHGYTRVGIMGRRFLAHRVIWAMMTGEWPTDEIDHINGNRSDNRWSNLRQVDRLGNLRNAAIRKESSSGIKGVYFDKRRNHFIAYIFVNYKRIHLGSFGSAEDAARARQEAEREHGFHANHGRKPHDVAVSS